MCFHMLHQSILQRIRMIHLYQNTYYLYRMKNSFYYTLSHGSLVYRYSLRWQCYTHYLHTLDCIPSYNTSSKTLVCKYHNNCHGYKSYTYTDTVHNRCSKYSSHLHSSNTCCYPRNPYTLRCIGLPLNTNIYINFTIKCVFMSFLSII